MPNAPTKTTAWPVRLPATLLKRWRAYAEREGMTAAAAVRRVMVTTLDGAQAVVGLPSRAAKAKTGRLSITLGTDTLAQVREAAKADGRSLANWLAYLIQARVESAPLYRSEEWSDSRLGLVLDLAALRAAVQHVPVPLGCTAEEREVWRSAERTRIATAEVAVAAIHRRLDAMHELASERTRQLQRRT